MNQELILWILGQTIVYAGVIVTAYVKITNRLTRLETIMDLLGHKAAKVLHSPHTPELDSLLEKYLDRYYELSNDEWRELLGLCEQMEDNMAEPKAQRALAGIVGAICHHKLKHEPPKFKKHDA